ncbi:uncharacterized protein LOC114930654 [Nylanderia fulva]|uniref:uncharacterized protein LOC114930654 n=1 Tax=Nylanderia fulva TaxID=613905 RepID=UPI0010FB4583|nr:uncharacterized protein LOC114930654 [Nylanderia fulva]
MDLPSMPKENLVDLRHIADGAIKHIKALEALGHPTSHWDDLIVHVLSSKLDTLTMREWQSSLTGTNPPTFEEFNNFIIRRCQMLKATGKTISSCNKNVNKQSSLKRQASCVATVKPKCNFCNGDHVIYYCKDFLALSVSQRITEIRNRKICNCMRSSSHASAKCTSKGCRVCNAKHNTLLHLANNTSGIQEVESTKAKETNSVSSSTTLVMHAYSNSIKNHIMLSTAVINASHANGSTRTCVLLDNGSQANFISTNCMKLLGLRSRPLNISITGIGDTATKSTHVVRIESQVTFRLSLLNPEFNILSSIDILIRAEVFLELLCVRQIRASSEHPTLQKMQFGWILAGCLNNLPMTTHNVQSFHATLTNNQMHDQLSRFWDEEDPRIVAEHTKAETFCENHFLANTSQDSYGKYTVKLPVNESLINQLGDSKNIALKRLRNLEKRFCREPALKEQYARFISEYLSLGHMKQVSELPNEHEPSYYLPHHCVFKGSGPSSKIRVVFDASCKSASGVSLNNALSVGPVVQQDLTSILLRFLTYGTSSASFLATRCLKNLAERYASKFPVGSTHLLHDFYVDDMLTGADSIQEAKSIRDEIIQLLKLGSFELSKWASNHPQLLDSFDSQGDKPIPIEDKTPMFWGYNGIKTLTRLIGPTIVIAKLILQDLWKLGVQWDESPPLHIHTRWSTIKSQLVELNQLTIPRRVKFDANPQAIQIHGFCDASQHAYGACVYIKTGRNPSNYRAELLCSKSRVAPLKAISLPRLELSAALILARLIERIQAAIDLSDIQIYLWSDLTITLNWIASPSRKWAVFVANQVGEIQRLTESKCWRHVLSAQNPADMLSRGLNPRDVINASTWWHGPNFLQLDQEHWPSSDFPQLGEGAPEMRKIFTTTTIVDCDIVDKLLSKYSNLDKTCRILAYCLRFVKASPRQQTCFISHEETSAALHLMCRLIQRRSFPKECKALTNSKAINLSSKILSLSPFMDEQELVRVGSRLKNSNLSFAACHPILLPRDQQLTKQIIIREHRRNMHAGTQATMAAVRQQFWPLSLRFAARKIILGCVKCFKAKPTFSEALMASLPAGRVTVSRPFSHCGVDYAGPIILKEGKRRNAQNHKAYISLFVCFATKAIHLEVVSDLTTETFIAAFKRFILRRGKPSHMYSDNGTTFVGAQNQLKEFFEFLNKDRTQDDVKQFLRDQQISWNFIPPHSLHCGGLWEAAVKSAKYHMTRVISNAHLTFEEMQTVLCEIEAILNSHPITALA